MQNKQKNVNLHDNYDAEKSRFSIEKSSGWVFAGLSALIALVFYQNPDVSVPALTISTLFIAAHILKPEILTPFSAVLMKFGEVLRRVLKSS